MVLAMAAPQLLPRELEELIEHGDRWSRLGVIDELWGHPSGGTAGMGTAARQALERMTHDVDPVVAAGRRSTDLSASEASRASEVLDVAADRQTSHTPPVGPSPEPRHPA